MPEQISSYSRSRDRLSPVAAKITGGIGVTQIILGLLSVTSQSIVIAWSKEHGECMFFIFLVDEVVPEVAAGVWIGFSMVIVGVVGLKTAISNNFGVILINAAVCLLLSMLVVVMIGLTATHIEEVRESFCTFDQEYLAFIFDGLMIGCAVITFFISLWSFGIAVMKIFGCCQKESLVANDYAVSYDNNSGELSSQPPAYNESAIGEAKF